MLLLRKNWAWQVSLIHSEECRVQSIWPYVWEMWQSQPHRQSLQIKAVDCSGDRECDFQQHLRHHEPWGLETSHDGSSRLRQRHRMMGEETIASPAIQASGGQTTAQQLRQPQDRLAAAACTMHLRRHARYWMSKLPIRSGHPSQTGDVQKQPDPGITTYAGGKQKWHPHLGRHSAGTIVAGLRRRNQEDDICDTRCHPVFLE